MLEKISFTEVQNVCDRQMLFTMEALIGYVSVMKFDQAITAAWQCDSIRLLAFDLGVLSWNENENIRDSIHELVYRLIDEKYVCKIKK